MARFNKRIFTFRTIAGEVASAAAQLPTLARAYLKPGVPAALREKVMLGTTSVNDCRYCSWVHSAVALRHGVDLGELNEFLSDSSLDCCDEREATAILYAQHYAATAGHPEPELYARLEASFGVEDSRELIAYIKGINFANLFGNTFDALLSRLRGSKAEDSSLAFELAFALVAAPILVPALPLMKRS